MLKDFTLADGQGTPHTLSTLTKKHNVLLVFYRGVW